MSIHPEPEFERPELSALLGAASAPGDERELAGETAAVWQFRTVHAGASAAAPARHRRGRTVFKAVLANALATKVALAGAAAVAAGGVVLAAETGAWPTSPMYLVAPPAVSASAAPHQPGEFAAPSDPGEPSEGTGTDAPPSSPGEPTESDTGSGSSDAAPTPSMTGLCKAYRARPVGTRGKALANPAFAVLVSTAGGADNISTYCTGLIGPAATRPSHALPSRHGLARGHTKGAPGSRGHGYGRQHGRGAGHGKTHPGRHSARWSNHARGTPMRT